MAQRCKLWARMRETFQKTSWCQNGAPGSPDEIYKYKHKYKRKYKQKYKHKHKREYKNEGDIPENRLMWKWRRNQMIQ